MKIPTAAQLKAADKRLRELGPISDESAALLEICLRDPVTVSLCREMASNLNVDLAVVLGTYVAGIHLGLKLAEETSAARVN